MALLDTENNSMCTAVLYGVYATDDQIVAVAASQLGNVGVIPKFASCSLGSQWFKDRDQ